MGGEGGRFGERPGTCLGRVTGARCPSIVKGPQDEPKFMRKWTQATYRRLPSEVNVLKDFGAWAAWEH